MPAGIIFTFRRKTAAQWTTDNPVLLAGELGLETDTGRFKFGNGASTWNAISYPPGGAIAAASITDSTAAGRDMLTAANVAAQTAILNTFTDSLKGLAPASGGGTLNFLRADGTWAEPPGVIGAVPWTNITGQPTTLSGYGITDAVALSGDQTIAGNKTFTGAVTFQGASVTVDANFTLQDNGDPTKQAQFQLANITTGSTRVYTLPDGTGTIPLNNANNNFSNSNSTYGSGTATGTIGVAVGATISGATKTVNIGTGGVSGSTTNITLGSAVSGSLGTFIINSPTVSFGANVTSISLPDAATFLIDNADATKRAQFEVSGITTGTTRTLTVPDLSGTLALTAGAQTLSNKTLDSTNTVTLLDTGFTLQDNGDPARQAQFDLSAMTPGSTRVFTLPDGSGMIPLLSGAPGAQTFTTQMIFSGLNNTLGSSTGNTITNVASGATLNGNTKTVNIGTGGVSGSTTNVTIGSAVSGSLGSLIINSPAISFGATVTSISLPDAATFLTDNADPTKRAQFEVSGVAAGTTRTLTIPDASGTLALLSGAQTFAGLITFGAGADVSGILGLVPQSGDPGGVADGDLWYNSTLGKFRAREGGVTVDLISTGGGGGGTSVGLSVALARNDFLF